MKHITALLLGLVFTLTLARAVMVPGDPATTTFAAYQTAMAHFGFSPEILRHQKPFLAPDLYAALMKKANQPVAKGDAPDIEGDVILNSQELPDKFDVGRTTVSGAHATVRVTLSWGTETRHYFVQLTQINGAWKITDIDYNKDGKLSDLLK